MGLLSDRRRPYLSAPVADRQQLQVKVWILGGFVLLLFGLLTIQLVRLQLFRQVEFESRATINRIRTIDTPAVRGLIFDRNGNPLVENVPAFAVTVVPADVPDGEEAEVARRLAALLPLPAYEIEARLLERKRSVDPFLPVVLETDASSALAFTIAGLRSELPGVQVETIAKRRYTNGELLAHVLGYIGPISLAAFEELQADRYRLADRIGQTGVEAFYESILRGVPGRRQVEVDASGREIRELSSEAAAAGQGLVLTIDLALQEAVQQILLESMGGSLFAAAVVVDVQTGDLLAIVSVPTYDANLFSGRLDDEALAAILDNPGRPLVNHAIADQFPPGSIFKIITGPAALQEGVIGPEDKIVSSGVIIIQNAVDPRITYELKDTVQGEFDFVKGMAFSSNVYFWHLAGGSPFRRPVAEEFLTPEDLAEQQRLIDAGFVGGEQEFLGLGVERLANWARQFGMDTPTAIDLAGEVSGFIPDAAWKARTFGEAWGQGDSYNMGIGQGFVSVTPMQMVMATAAIANGGTVYEPRVVNALLDIDGNTVRRFRPRIKSQLTIDPEYLALVRQGMGMAVLGGSAGNAWVREMQVAGKTGTAEFGNERLFRGNFATHGWFVGFAPFEEPEIAVVVFHELGAGFLTAEAGGQIMAAWGELSGVYAQTQPALGQVISIAEGEFELVAARLEARLR